MKTILVVDDEPDVLTIVRIRLAKNRDYRILEAANGEEALALTKREHPDLIILDWLMPGLSGKDFLRTVRADPDLAETPVIMMTVKAERSAQAEGRELGVRAYIIKPFDADLLMDKVREALTKRR